MEKPTKSRTIVFWPNKLGGGSEVHCIDFWEHNVGSHDSKFFENCF